MLHMDPQLGVSEVRRSNKVTETRSGLRRTVEAPHLHEKKLSLNKSYHSRNCIVKKIQPPVFYTTFFLVPLPHILLPVTFPVAVFVGEHISSNMGICSITSGLDMCKVKLEGVCLCCGYVQRGVRNCLYEFPALNT